VAVTSGFGAGGTIWVSPDGANWTQTSIVASGSLNAVASGGYQYIAVGNSGAILGSVLVAASSPSVSSGSFSFTAYGLPGMEYGVYDSNTLPPTWTFFENITIPAGSTSTTVTLPTSTDQEFYALGPPGP
jgi:hypothetical protein